MPVRSSKVRQLSHAGEISFFTFLIDFIFLSLPLHFTNEMFQVLAKASKIIPVMIMGKIVSRNKYEYYEYVTAVLISIGMTLFMLGSSTNETGKTVVIKIFIQNFVHSFALVWKKNFIG